MDPYQIEAEITRIINAGNAKLKSVREIAEDIAAFVLQVQADAIEAGREAGYAAGKDAINWSNLI